ncbi:MAG: hypothetical protein ACXADY_01915 [Candidatus Hodarchaeales archaeon]
MVTEAKAYSSMFLIIFSIIFIVIPIWFVFKDPFIPTLFLAFLILYSLAGYKISVQLLTAISSKKFYFPKIDFNNFLINSKRKINYPLIVFGITLLATLIYLFMFIPSLTTPIRPRGDTGTHALRSILFIYSFKTIFSLIGINLSYFQINLLLLTLSFAIGLFFLFVYILFFRKNSTEIKEFVKSATFKKIVFIILVIFYSFYIILSLFLSVITETRLLPSLIRYGPVSAYIYNIPNFFLPISELNFRILNLVISFSCAVFSYKMLRLFFSQSVSIFGTISFFFTPIVFNYVYLEYLVIGLLFFQLASFYYLLSYLKTKKANYLYISYLIAFVAIFYKDPLILLIPLYLFIGIVYSFHQTKLNMSKSSLHNFFQEFRLFFYLSIICIFYYLPWYFLYNMFVWRSYNFTPDYLFNLNRILMYLNATMNWLGVIFFLAIAGLLFRSATKKLNYLDFLTIPWYFILYIFYTFDYWPSPEPRFIIPGLFLFYYNAGELIYLSIEKVRNLFLEMTSKSIISPAFSSFVFIIILFPLIIDSYQMSQKEFDNNYLPFNEVSLYLKENLPATSSILVRMGPNPYFFYFYKFELDIYFRTDFWNIPDDQNSSNLFLFCQGENIQYVMFPNYEWSVDYINKDLIEMIENDEKFLLLKEFQYRKSESFLFLFQVKINSTTVASENLD